MNKIIEAANKAKEQIKTKNLLLESETKKLQSEKYEIASHYRDKIWQLERQKREKEYEIENKIAELDIAAKAEFTELRKPIKELKKIVSLMHLLKQGKQDLNLVAYNYYYGDKKYVELVDTLVDDKCLNLRVYMYENRKPKNKYTLCLAGASIFYDNDLINYPHDYGCDIHFENRNVSIIVNLKEAPTKQELLNWWNKNKNRTFWNSEEHAELVKLYEWVKENCNTDEWELAYLFDRKDYYENHYSRGTETEEYKEVIKQIERLTDEG